VIERERDIVDTKVSGKPGEVDWTLHVGIKLQELLNISEEGRIIRKVFILQDRFKCAP
jgi:hypothetical protein